MRRRNSSHETSLVHYNSGPSRTLGARRGPTATEASTLGALVAWAARRWGAREALCFRGRRSTFAAVAAGVDRVARGLIGLGVRPGDRVALWMPNRPEWIEAAFVSREVYYLALPAWT